MSEHSWPWALRMNWLDLAFFNWPVPAETLARTLPPGTELDTFEGEAWISIVPFRMTGIAPRLVPDLPGVSAFAELNVRTYVKVGGVPGVWFYSLDAGNPLAVAAARLAFHLPYFNALMQVTQEGGITRYASRRIHHAAPAGIFAAAYQPYGLAFQAQPGTLADWLTGRLTLYSADQRGRIYRGKILHQPWTLRPAQQVIKQNTLVDSLGLTLVGEPYALHADFLSVRAWLLERVY